MGRPVANGVWLRLLVHLDAFRAAPARYLAACWWRFTGKRVRARARFAPLLALSSRAYRLWLMQEAELGAGERELEGAEHEGPAIIAVVEASGLSETAACRRTVCSLEREGIAVRVLDRADLSSLVAGSSGIDPDSGAWLLPLIAGDELAPGTGAAYRRAAAAAQYNWSGQGSGPRIIYADDDLIDTAGRRHTPHLKPDWNAELFAHCDFLTGAAILRVKREDLAELPPHSWAGMLTARLVRQSGGVTASPVHLRQVLHHRRARPASRPPAPLPINRAALPPVSVIVPTRNRLDLLRTCLDGLARTEYPDFEILIVDNGSDDPATLDYLSTLDPARHRILRMPGPFNFSKLNNHAAQAARSELLCLLNNDIEVLSPDWLAILASQALRPDVGAAGARLLYPDGRIQHAGVVLGVGGGAAHAHRLLRPDEEGYFHRHALPQFVSAVTAACLVVRRDRFRAVGGLDEDNFPVAFNDVDLCMKLNRKGWQSFYEPRATLLHHESVSRGLDRDPVGMARFARELEALKRLWGTDEGTDPFHHPQLSPFSERFVVRL